MRSAARAAPEAAQAATEDLGQIGDGPVTNVVLKPLTPLPSLPKGGHLVSLGKATPVSELVVALCARLGVSADLVALGYEGRDLDPGLPLRDNGVVELGAVARKLGTRIELVFTLQPGTAIALATGTGPPAPPQAAETHQQRQRASAAAAAAPPQAAGSGAGPSEARGGSGGGSVAAGRAAAAAAAGDAAKESPQRVAASGSTSAPPMKSQRIDAGAGAPAPGAGGGGDDRCRLVCSLLGGGQAAMHIQTRLSATPVQAAEALHRALDLPPTEGILLLRGGEMLQGDTLGAAGLVDGAHVDFCFAAVPGAADGAAAPGAPPAHAAAGASAPPAEPRRGPGATVMQPAAQHSAAAAQPSRSGGPAPQLAGDPLVPSADDFLGELRRTGGWPIAPPDAEVAEVRALTGQQLAALTHVRRICRERHEEALPVAIQRAESLGFCEFDFVRTLEWIREQAPLMIAFDITTFGERLANDTHYRNSFETKTSLVKLDHSYRKKVEDTLFGNAYKDAKAFDRVKYGVLNFANDPAGFDALIPYGTDYLVLKGMRLRTTLAHADSFSVQGEILSTTDYCAHTFSGYTDEEFRAALKLGSRQATSEETRGMMQHGTYKEAQFHGEIRLADHVQHIVVDGAHRGNRALEGTVARLRAACGGCPVLWKDRQEDLRAASAIPKSLRELSYERRPDA